MQRQPGKLSLNTFFFILFRAVCVHKLAYFFEPYLTILAIF